MQVTAQELGTIVIINTKSDNREELEKIAEHLVSSINLTYGAKDQPRALKFLTGEMWQVFHAVSRIVSSINK